MPRISSAASLSKQTLSILKISSEGPTPSNSPFLKQLASSNSLTRDKALDHLRQYLRTRASLTPLDHLKLWKGLFYCVWHSDRPRAQQSLARDLASLLHILPNDEATASWLEAFWETMAREWGGIPSLRMDKYLYLCRLHVKAGFEWCRRGNWEKERTTKLLDILQACPLTSELERPALTNGMRFHVLDVYIDEMDAVRGPETGDSNKGDEAFPVEALVAPVRRLKTVTKDRAVRKRAREALDDPRLREWLGLSNEGLSDEES